MMKMWKDALVRPETSLEEAIRILDKVALQILLVTNEQHALLGTVTDGDIRRALLSHKPLQVPLSEVMNRAPCTAGTDWSVARMLATMETRQLSQLPVTDAKGILVDLKTLHALLQKPRQDNAIFLMAGGFGTRLRPLTKHCPKPLLKVGEKPILELILESFVNSGFHRFFISTHYMPEMIREHFGDGSRWNVDITYVHENEPLGTAGSLSLLPMDTISEPILMMNGDLLTTLNFLSLLAFHEEHGGAATMCVRKYEQQIPYGVIEFQGSRVAKITEKPSSEYYVNAGIYILSPDLVRSVPRGEKIDMPSLLQSQIGHGHQINMFPLEEYWLDIGRIDDYQRAQTEADALLSA